MAIQGVSWPHNDTPVLRKEAPDVAEAYLPVGCLPQKRHVYVDVRRWFMNCMERILLDKLTYAVKLNFADTDIQRNFWNWLSQTFESQSMVSRLLRSM